MDTPRAPRRTVPILIDDAIEAVADIEQARSDAANHRRLAEFHAGRASRIEAKVIDTQVVVAAERLAALRARRERLAAREDATAPPVEVVAGEAATAYRGPDRRRADRPAPKLGLAA